MVGLRIYTVAVTAACVLQVQYQRKKTICEKRNTASSQFDCRNSRNFAHFGKFRLQFFCTVLYKVPFIFHLNAFLVSFCTKRIRSIFALLTAGKGKRTDVYAEIFVS